MFEEILVTFHAYFKKIVWTDWWPIFSTFFSQRVYVLSFKSSPFATRLLWLNLENCNLKNNTDRISSKNSMGQLFILSPLKGSIIQGKVIIRGRRIFQILLPVLTGSLAPNILFYYPFNLKKKKKKKKKRIVTCLFSASGVESSLIGFSWSDCNSASSFRNRRWREGKEKGGLFEGGN